MAVKVGINGFGRIGRQIINVMADKGVLGKTLDVVAVVDVEQSIRQALSRRATRETSHLRIAVADGKALVEGVVASADERPQD